jgi:hypothetical protein
VRGRICLGVGVRIIIAISRIDQGWGRRGVFGVTFVGELL